MTTIGGVVFRYLDRLPKVGDTVGMDGYVATVLEMDGHRLARVRVAKGRLEDLKDQSQEAEEPEAGDGEAQPPVGETIDGEEGGEPARPPADVVHLSDLKTGDAPDERGEVGGDGEKPQRQSEERG